MRKIIFICLLLCGWAAAQTHTFPALDTNNEFTGTDQFLLGVQLGPVTFAGLSGIAAVNGTVIYISDGTSGASCSGGGTGAFAFRVNGSWTCSLGSGGSGLSGSGTAGTIAEWNGSTALGNSPIVDGGSAGITITTPSAGAFAVNGASTGTQLLLNQPGAGTTSYLGTIPFSSISGYAGTFSYCQWITNGTMACSANSGSSGQYAQLGLTDTAGGSGLSSWLLTDNEGNEILGSPSGAVGWPPGIQIRTATGFPITFINNSTSIAQVTNSGIQLLTGTLTLQPITGTQCLQAISGVVSGTGSACGSGGGSGNVSTAPSGSQNIVQPQVSGAATQFTANDQSGIRYVVPADNWSITGIALTAGVPASITLPAGYRGIDVSDSGEYFVYIVQSGTSEIAQVTGGTYTRASGGTIVVTPVNTYTSGTVGSASSGIQEAVNDAVSIPYGPNAKVVLPAVGANANALPVYGTVWLHGNHLTLDGTGSMVNCYTRDRCILMGSLVTTYDDVTIRGLRFGTLESLDGCQITNTARSSGVVTVTTTGSCSVVTGDTVVIDFTDNPTYWGAHGPVTVSGSTITYSQAGATLASAATPGTIAPQNAAIEDSAQKGKIKDVELSSTTWGEQIVADNDQAMVIENNDNAGTGGLLHTANHVGSMVYAPGNVASGAPVITVNNANWSLQCNGNGLTDYVNNVVKISNSVIQGYALWSTNTSTIKGNYGGTELDNVYNEEGLGPCTSPYEGSYFSAAGNIFFSGANPIEIRAGEQSGGNYQIPKFANTGSTQYNYYVIAHDTTASTYSAPLWAGYADTNGSGTISGQFPHIPFPPGDTGVYDILRMVPSSLGGNAPAFPPYGSGNCPGGSTSACGSIVTSQAQCSTLVCTFTDTASSNTASYTVNNPSWFPNLPYWPGGLVQNGTGGTASYTFAFVDQDNQTTSVFGSAAQTVFALQCNGNLAGVLGSCLNGRTQSLSSFPIVGAWLKPVGGVTGANGVKGTINFIPLGPSGIAGVLPQEYITFVDSNPSKTLATSLNRPSWDANDTYVASDVASSGVPVVDAQLAFGAPIAISNYIGSVPDNASYKERLTATLKTFTVPITTNSQLTSTLVTGTAPLVIASTTPVANLTLSNHPEVYESGALHTADKIYTNSQALTAGTATHTFANSFTFASSSSYGCSCTDQTAANACQALPASASSVTVVGTGSDILWLQCIGH